MALTDGESGGIPATMLVGPTNLGTGYAQPYPVYQQPTNSNNGFGDGNGWWIILLILIIAIGGWGNNNGNNGGYGNTQPIIVNEGSGRDYGYAGNAVQRGFDQAAIMSGINGIQAGVNGVSSQICNCCGDVQQSLCNGFAGVNATVNNGFAGAEIAANGRQMANMNQAFGMQTAMSQGFNGVQSQLADCCCENRLASADLKYTIATENCADRYEAAQNTRDIIEAINTKTQSIQDKLCQLELDGVKQNYENRIAGMQNVIDGLSAQVNASDRRVAIGEEVDALYNRLNNCPVPTTPVYGRTPIFTCNTNNCGCNNGCGCGCGCGM